MEIIDKLIYAYHAKKNKDRFAVFINDCIGLHIINHKVYEKKELDLILDYLPDNVLNNVCIDIGANIGNHSLYLSKYFKSVIGFEPQEDLFTLLKLNTKYQKNIRIFNYGLSDKEEKLKIYYDDLNRMGGSFTKKNFKYEIVKTEIFDKIFNKLSFSFIKIDVEGYELKALKGMEKSIINNKPIIAFEGKVKDRSVTIKYLTELGYDKFFVPNDYKINSIIKSKNIILISIRYLIRKLSFGFKYNLINFNPNSKRDYNLIIGCISNSKYKLKT